MKKAQQQEFVGPLQEMRTKLLANAEQALKGDVHLDPDSFADEIDTASSESGLAFIGRLRERERRLLEKIDSALARIQHGTFGTCLTCEDPIGIERLRARPVATLCIECKSEAETRSE